MAGDNGTSTWGVSHLSNMPITVTFGVVLAVVLIVLILLRAVFGQITIGASAGAR
jgi:hypothetical protein